MKTDILVIGSGIAGLSFAIKASKFARIAIVTKDKANECNTNYAQGGLAAVFDKNDSYKLHIKDTLRAGDGLCIKKSVEFVVKNAPKQIIWLKEHGVRFDKRLSKEAVHSAPRIVHAGDITGERVEEVLLNNVRKNRNIILFEYHHAIKLIKGEGACIGVEILDINANKIKTVIAKATVLATGGLGRLYRNTCNPKIATGDGFALAYDAGADIMDMEFVQFHPTCLYGSNPTFLVSETLRGEGGRLLNIHKKPYMQYYHRDGDLAPRDVVSKFSVEEMQKTKSKFVYLDVRQLGGKYLRKRFPNIYKACLKIGVDMTKDLIPVSPTAHYSCGGIKIDLRGRTTVKQLYAIGEVSCSGIHGADRLASNSLTEGLVFSESLCNYLKSIIKKIKINEKRINNKIFIKKRINKNNLKKINKIKKSLQELMWCNVGIIRTEKGLKNALGKIKLLEKEINNIEVINKDVIELKNMIIVSKLVTISALRRKESRGTHFIKEYPKRDDKNWMKHLILNKNPIQKFL